jgi:membrane-associated phospholipid phosphatase
MQVIVAMLVCGVLGGLAGGALAWRWPWVSAPRISARTVVDEAERHPSFARLLWSRIGADRLSSYALGAALITAAIGGAVMGLVLWMIRTNEGLARYDLSAARWGATHATATSTDILRAVSQLGGTIGSITIAVVAATVTRRKVRLRSIIEFLATVLIGISVLVALIKVVVDRTRPDIDRLTGFSGASFPSGHAATIAATTAAVALLLGLGHDRRRRAVLTGLAVGISVGVASTRVLLGVHWLTDVIAGLVLGWTWFAIVSISFGGRLMRFAEPIEAAERALDAHP